jgi:acetolactate decarboxylase
MARYQLEPIMPFSVRHAIALTSFLLVFKSAAVLAQHGGYSGSQHAPAASTSGAEAQGAFAVRSFGAFREMIQKQDYAPKAVLGDVKALGATDAVGAVSGLRGEITMIDGRFVVSYGGGCTTCPPAHAVSAAFLGAGKVTEWSRAIPFPADLSGKARDDYIIAQAKSAGLDTSKPFPVRLKGTLINVAMHVIEAPNAGFTGHGSKVPMAKQDEYKHKTLTGEVVGLYAPADMQGVLSHPGEPFHFHWVDDQRTRTAHLEAFGLQEGAVLILPTK